MMFEFEDLAQKSLWWCDRAILAVLRLLAALSEVALLAGLVYEGADLVTNRMFTHLFPLLTIIWAWTQAAAVGTHLAVLPVQALEHRRYGNNGRYKLTIAVIVLLAVSASLSLVGTEWPFLRAVALVGVVLVGRLTKPMYSEDGLKS